LQSIQEYQKQKENDLIFESEICKAASSSKSNNNGPITCEQRELIDQQALTLPVTEFSSCSWKNLLPQIASSRCRRYYPLQLQLTATPVNTGAGQIMNRQP
jgi:hypothetical protein